jgi:alpha-beta hydrolase superfamily lysophospholipase
MIMTAMRQPPPKAADARGKHRGLAYELYLPGSSPPWPAVLILHGAGSRKENHADFARLASASGFAAMTYDQPGHGGSDGEMGPRILEDVGRMLRLLAAQPGVDGTRIGLRGSSMGGFLAIHAAAVFEEARGVVAICPAGEQHLRQGLKRDDLEMRVDRESLAAWLEEHDLRDAVERMGNMPLLLLHAKGDESIPWTWTQELYEHAGEPRKLVLLEGGDHRSAQHDSEMQGMAIRWLERALR